jgi:hypothetical protein
MKLRELQIHSVSTGPRRRDPSRRHEVHARVKDMTNPRPKRTEPRSDDESRGRRGPSWLKSYGRTCWGAYGSRATIRARFRATASCR